MVQVYPNFFWAIFKSLVYGLLNNYRSSIKSLFTRRADVYYNQTATAPLKLSIYDITFLRMINLAMIMA